MIARVHVFLKRCRCC